MVMLLPIVTEDADNVGVVALGMVVSASDPLALALPDVYDCPVLSVTLKLKDMDLAPSELCATVSEPLFNVTVEEPS